MLKTTNNSIVAQQQLSNDDLAVQCAVLLTARPSLSPGFWSKLALTPQSGFFVGISFKIPKITTGHNAGIRQKQSEKGSGE